MGSVLVQGEWLVSHLIVANWATCQEAVLEDLFTESSDSEGDGESPAFGGCHLSVVGLSEGLSCTPRSLSVAQHLRPQIAHAVRQGEREPRLHYEGRSKSGSPM